MRILVIISAIVLFGCSGNSADGLSTPPPRTPTPTPGTSATPTPKPTITPAPTATPKPTATPPIVNGIQQYGTAPDGTKLHWKIFQPIGTGPWPFVIIIHGGGFRTGSINEGSQVAADLQAAGYFAASIEYRVDTNKLPGQTSSGTWHQQTDDVKMAVRAARSNSHCDGNVFAVGGSAGGTHASSIAIEHETSSTWAASDRVDAAVCISGAYKFDDRTPSQYLAQQTRDFNDYTATTDLAKQLADSPISFVDKTAMPMYLVRSQNDPMPVAHQNALIAKLNSFGVINFQFITVAGQGHSFANWPAVSIKAIAFLNSHRKRVITPTPTPSATATPTASSTPSPTPSPTPVVVREYPKGVWGLGGDTPELLAPNKGLVGVNLSVFWSEVEKTDGVLDLSGLDDKVARAKAAGFTKLIVSVTASLENSPDWLVNERKTAGQTITFLDPGHEGTTYGKPIETVLPWDARYQQKRLDLYAAVAAHYKDDPDVIGSFTSFANHRTGDWNMTDSVATLTNIPASACPPPAGSYVDGTLVPHGDGTCDVSIDQPSQWLAKGFTREKMEGVGKAIITANAQNWFPKLLKLPIGGLDGRLANTSPDPRGGSGNYSTMAYDIVTWIDSQPFKEQLYISRNTFASTWGPPPITEPSNHDSEAEIKWIVASRAPLTGAQTVTSAVMCVPDGHTPCRLNGNQPTTDLNDVMQRALNAMVGYHGSFVEVWYGDAKNPAFYDMIKGATVAMGGTPRN